MKIFIRVNVIGISVFGFTVAVALLVFNNQFFDFLGITVSENYILKKTPKKVNIDVLKRKIYEQQKKEKMVGRIAIFTFFSFICVIGFIISA